MAEEIWADIPGYEGWYQASSLGRVKRIRKEHWNHGKRNIVEREHILNPTHDKKGYQVVILSNPDLKVRKHIKVHRLVATTFIDNPYCYDQIDHIDRNKDNNSIDNLRWCDNHLNMFNRENTVLLTYKGITTSLADWSSMTGIKVGTIRARIARGWSIEDALSLMPLKEGEKLWQTKLQQQIPSAEH